MKLRAITLNNVRRFTTPATVSKIGDGLNVLCEPNEHGKSTLFDAIQALFFKPYGSSDKDIKALKPHAGGAPEVSIDVETPEGVFTIHKRWTSKAEATVHQNGRLIAQADAAEAWIGRLLGAGTGGPAGLVWVRQGMTGLAGGSKKEEDAALEARRNLMSSVSEEVEAMTGGRRMDLALARCKAELSALATTTGQKKAGGLWRSASDRVDMLHATKAALSQTATELHDDLDQRKRKRRALAELEAPEAVATRLERLETATQSYRDAERHAENVDTEARKVAAARLTLSGAQAKLDTLRAALAEWQVAQRQTKNAASAHIAAVDQHNTARKAFQAAEIALETAQATLKSAEETQRRAERQQAARDGAARREELNKRILDAEAMRHIMEETAAAARIGPDQKALRNLESLTAELITAQATRDVMATQLVVFYDAGRDGSVRMADVPLEDGQSYPVPRGATLAIPGLGQIEVRSSAQESEVDAVEKAAHALDDALARLDLNNLDAARKAAELRMDAQTRNGEAKARLDGLAPDGIDALREAFALIPEAPEDQNALDPVKSSAALEQAKAAATLARSTRETTNETLAGAREALARCEADASSAKDRFERADSARASLGDMTVETLTADMQQAATKLQAAETRHGELLQAAPDFATAEATLTRARSVDDTAKTEIGRLRPELATLDERIARGSGDAVEERLSECEQELMLAQADLARVTHEVAVLRRLEGALEDARTQARERYFAPVASELKPLLQLLWPEAELVWGQDTLLPEALIRDGLTEPIDVLSGGTQEQVALLVRLAFARMLSRDGRHAPVLLDDALVFTDDDRIERMFDALHRQAGDLQIIVLTCRQRAFRDLGGRSLRLAPASEETAREHAI